MTFVAMMVALHVTEPKVNNFINTKAVDKSILSHGSW